jgi:hypothetical protein
MRTTGLKAADANLLGGGDWVGARAGNDYYYTTNTKPGSEDSYPDGDLECSQWVLTYDCSDGHILGSGLRSHHAEH